MGSARCSQTHLERLLVSSPSPLTAPETSLRCLQMELQGCRPHLGSTMFHADVNPPIPCPRPVASTQRPVPYTLPTRPSRRSSPNHACGDEPRQEVPLSYSSILMGQLMNPHTALGTIPNQALWSEACRRTVEPTSPAWPEADTAAVSSASF